MKLLKTVIGLLFPQNCRICSEFTVNGEELCEKCKETFIRESFTRCPECDKSVAGCLCGTQFTEHIKRDIGGKSFISLTFYDKTAADRLTEKLIFRLKDRCEFAEFFAAELAREIKSHFSRSGENIEDWTVTYIPRSAQKFSEKGFDQSEEIAKRLAKMLRIKYSKTFFRGVSGTVQKSLTREQRRANAEESIFPMKKSINKGGKYLLFDDIITTGSSMETAIKHLYFCGAQDVFPISVARSLQKRK